MDNRQQGLRVLVVDDDAEDYSFLARGVKALADGRSIALHHYSSPREALALLHAEPFDATILDHHLGPCTGPVAPSKK